MIHVKRVYDPEVLKSSRKAGDEVTSSARSKRGATFLVDRLWPRGVKKEALQLDGWLKDAAPSNELRHWYGHDPAKWQEFRRRYFAELDAQPAAWAPLVEAAHRGQVTLLFSSKELELNNAVALKDYLEAHLKKRSAGRAARGRKKRSPARG